MAKLTKTRVGFDLSPEGIVAQCSDLSPYFKDTLIGYLEQAWDESEPFEVELEVPMWEEPYGYFVRIKVVPSDERFTIERSLS